MVCMIAVFKKYSTMQFNYCILGLQAFWKIISVILHYRVTIAIATR